MDAQIGKYPTDKSNLLTHLLWVRNHIEQLSMCMSCVFSEAGKRCPKNADAEWPCSAHEHKDDLVAENLTDDLVIMERAIKMVKSNDIDPQAAERAVNGLMSMCVCSDRAEALSHNELADALTDVVWAELDMTGYPSALIDEAINRLRKIDAPCPVMGEMIHDLAQLNRVVD